MSPRTPIRRGCWGAAAMLAVFTVSPAAAQLNGVPIWSPGLPVAPFETALMVHGTSGNDAFGDTGSDWGGTFMVRGMLAERVTLTGGFGGLRRNVAVDDQAWRPQYFLSAALTVVQGSDAVGDFEYGVSVLSGVGTSSLPGSGSENNVPLGVDLVGHFNRGGYYVQVSLLPRWSWRYTNLGLGGAWQNGPGFTGGVTAGTHFGVALIVAVDKVWLDATSDPVALPETNPLAWSAGLRWTL